MNSNLAGVDWPGVLGELADAEPAAVAEMIVAATSPTLHLLPAHRLLARLARQASCLDVERVLAGRGCQSPGPTAAWLCYAGKLFHELDATVANTEVIKQQQPAPVPPGSGALRVDPALDGLPLLDLASDIAERRVRRGAGQYLVVCAAELLDLNGCVQFEAPVLGDDGEECVATVVRLADATLKTWAHELGHLLDPRYADRTYEQAQRYADLVGMVLVHLECVRQRGQEPLMDLRTVENVAALIASVDAMVGIASPDPDPTAVDEIGMPAPGPSSVLAFMGLPLSDAPVATA